MCKGRGRRVAARTRASRSRVYWPALVRGVVGTVFGLVLVLAAPAQTSGTEVWIVLSENSGAYRQVVTGIESALAAGPRRPVTRILARDEFPAATTALAEPGLVVSVGADAGRVSVIRSGQPKLLTLLPKSTYDALSATVPPKNAPPLSGIYLDQPPARLLRLVRIGLPEARNVAMVFGPASVSQLLDYDAAARDQGLNLQAVTVTDERQLFGALTRALDGADVLVAVPDPRVFNSHTAQNVLLETYRRRIPVIGYSEAYVEAGALMSLYSTPEQIGRQAGEWIVEAPRPSGLRLPVASFPKYFTVRSNPRVARSLALDLPPDRQLMQRLGAAPETTP